MTHRRKTHCPLFHPHARAWLRLAGSRIALRYVPSMMEAGTAR